MRPQQLYAKNEHCVKGSPVSEQASNDECMSKCQTDMQDAASAGVGAHARGGRGKLRV